SLPINDHFSSRLHAINVVPLPRINLGLRLRWAWARQHGNHTSHGRPCTSFAKVVLALPSGGFPCGVDRRGPFLAFLTKHRVFHIALTSRLRHGAASPSGM